MNEITTNHCSDDCNKADRIVIDVLSREEAFEEFYQAMIHRSDHLHRRIGYDDTFNVRYLVRLLLSDPEQAKNIVRTRLEIFAHNIAVVSGLSQ